MTRRSAKENRTRRRFAMVHKQYYDIISVLFAEVFKESTIPCLTRIISHCVVVPPKQAPRHGISEVVYCPVQIGYLCCRVVISATHLTGYASFECCSIRRRSIAGIAAGYLGSAGARECVTAKLGALW